MTCHFIAGLHFLFQIYLRLVLTSKKILCVHLVFYLYIISNDDGQIYNPNKSGGIDIYLRNRAYLLEWHKLVAKGMMPAKHFFLLSSLSGIDKSLRLAKLIEQIKRAIHIRNYLNRFSKWRIMMYFSNSIILDEKRSNRTKLYKKFLHASFT